MKPTPKIETDTKPKVIIDLPPVLEAFWPQFATFASPFATWRLLKTSFEFERGEMAFCSFQVKTVNLLTAATHGTMQFLQFEAFSRAGRVF